MFFVSNYLKNYTLHPNYSTPNEFSGLTLYPNPARDKVYIDPGPGQALKQVNIYTMTGAYLYSENGREINTGRLSGGGMYLFEIVTKKGNRSMRKVIIQ